MLNAKDVSGMYSKTGRVLYEKMHILRRKDEILLLRGEFPIQR